MELVIEYLIIFALGWFIGSRITGYFQLQVFKQLLIDLKIDNKDLIRVARNGAPEIIQQQLDQLESHVDAAGLEQIDIKVEKHFFWFVLLLCHTCKFATRVGEQAVTSTWCSLETCSARPTTAVVTCAVSVTQVAS
jgi:hypothetical protein